MPGSPKMPDRTLTIPSESERLMDAKERFDRVLKDRLDYVQDGNWKAEIRSLEDLHSIRIKKLQKEGKTKELSIVPIYDYTNRYRLKTTGSTSMKLTQDGDLEASQTDWELLEKRLSTSRDKLRLQLLNEVLSTIEEYKPAFWTQQKDLLLPLKPDPDEVGADVKENQGADPIIDSKRLAYWPKCPDALFGTPTTTDGYWAICFKNFAVYDNPAYRNAVFGHFFDEEWPVPADAEKRPAEYRMPESEREAYEKKFFSNIPTSKDEINKMKAQGILIRKYHPEKDLTPEAYNKKMDEIMKAFRAHAERRQHKEGEAVAA